MNRQRQRELEAQRRFKKGQGPFEQVDLTTRPHPHWMTRCFQNNHYIVMIDDKCPTDKGPAIRAMVQKNNNAPITDHWSEMQRIKNEIFGPETVAVEYYPAQSEKVDVANIYWLWIFPEGVLPKPIIA